MTPLRDYLLAAYGGFADARPCDPSQDCPIKIDDQDRDVSHLFCHMYVQVPDRDGVSITLTMHNAPLNAAAKDLIVDRGGDIIEDPLGLKAILRFNINEITFLRTLSRTIRNTVGRGRRYLDSNWRWICPRTADSLDNFADVVMAFRTNRKSANRSSRADPVASQTRIHRSDC